MAADPKRTVAELKKLRELTSDESGAQRVAWTETWERARAWLRDLVTSAGAEESIDAAGNQWFTLRGESERAVLIGGHIDSVPNGGWLDGCLNVMAGVEVLRRIAEEGTPPVTVRLVDWADEEGARFGRSLFGSSAPRDRWRTRTSCGTHRSRRDSPRRGRRVRHRSRRRPRSAAELEKRRGVPRTPHRAGPGAEALGLPMGVVLGTFGVERHRITFPGQAAHSGSTPMDQRRDALAGVSKLAWRFARSPRSDGGGGLHVGRDDAAGHRDGGRRDAEQTLDQRHLDAQRLAAMLAEREGPSERIAAEEKIDVEWKSIWPIQPFPFHPR